MTIVLPGRVPSKKNSKRIICFGSKPRVLPSLAYEQWHEAMLWHLKVKRPKRFPETRVTVAIVIYADSMRLFDLSNSAESVMDLLVEAEIIEDDSWRWVPQLMVYFGGLDRKAPRAEVTIEPADVPISILKTAC